MFDPQWSGCSFEYPGRVPATKGLPPLATRAGILSWARADSARNEVHEKSVRTDRSIDGLPISLIHIGHVMQPFPARLVALFSILITACTGVPEGIEPVDAFHLERYLGKWYEIARLDHSFERGLSDVSAEYALRADGGVVVLNRGFDARSGRWTSAEGKADFIAGPTRGSLKVSFFGPFYGGYHVVALDPDYRWALVVGPSRGYLWILARERQLTENVQAELLEKAKQLGFATEKLIWVSQTRPDA